jgi:Tfp pilus assembly protein PilW
MLPNTEKKRRQRGAAMVEFTIAGVAALTLMVSTVQIGLGMWN